MTAPWTAVSTPTQIVLAIQLFAATVGLVPVVRIELRQATWFVALVVGPPLVWILVATSVGLIRAGDFSHKFSTEAFFAWVVTLPMVIGTTILLQLILARQYAARELRSLPMVGIIFGLLAILADIVFFLCVVTPM